MKTLILLFGSALMILLTACNTTDNAGQTSDTDATFKTVFDEKEVALINQVINYYDNFILSKTDKKKPIKDAYLDFITENASLVEILGDLSLFTPLREDNVAFFNTLDRDVLSNLFRISDTIYWYSSGNLIEEEFIPFQQFDINFPRYFDFMKILSTRNDFYTDYFNFVDAIGDLPSAAFAISVYSNNDYFERKKYNEAFNFSKKEDRFAFIVPFLFNSYLSDESNTKIHNKMELNHYKR